MHDLRIREGQRANPGGGGQISFENATLMRHKRCITTGKAGSKSITFTLKGLATSRPQASKRTL